MMNQKTVLAAALAALLLLSSCGTGTAGENGTTASVQQAAEVGAEEAAPQDAAGPASDPAFAEPGWEMTFDNGAVIPLGADASAVLEALGEPSDVMEAPSCIREGYDRVYTYGGAYTVTTAPDAAGLDRITEVTLLSDAVAVKENGKTVMIGSPVSDADAAFGEPKEGTEAVRRYAVSGGTLTVTAADGEITGISASYGS